MARIIRFSPRITLIGAFLIAGMLRLSYWQWQRHLYKQSIIATLDQRLEQPPVTLSSLLQKLEVNPESFIHRRVLVSGNYDFAHEMVLRNRRYEEMPGVYAITPLHIDGSTESILVNRGFIPLSKSAPAERKEFQRTEENNSSHTSFVGLIKPNSPRRFLGPYDPESGLDKPWVDGWLWFDVLAMQRQLPYTVLPVSLEIMNVTDVKAAREQIIVAKSERDEMFMMGSSEGTVQSPTTIKDLHYPVAVFDIIVPPGRHLGYVFEWAAMAIATALICLILQLRRPGSEAR